MVSMDQYVWNSHLISLIEDSLTELQTRKNILISELIRTDQQIERHENLLTILEEENG